MTAVKNKGQKEYHDKGLRRSYKRPPQPSPIKMKANSKIKALLIKRNEFNLEKLKEYMEFTHTIEWREFSSFPDMFLHEEQGSWATDKALIKLRTVVNNTLHNLAMEFPDYKKGVEESERFNKLYEHTLHECEYSNEEEKLKLLVHRICKEHNLTSKELDYFNVNDLEKNMTTRGNEYISTHMHTSTWSYYAKSHIIVNGKKYESEIQYDSETNRV